MPSASTTPASFRAFLATGGCGASLAGLVVAGLTLGLNPHLLDPWTDALLLLLELSAGAGLVGLLLGVAAWSLLRASARLGLPARARRIFDHIALSTLAFLPLAYLLLLPDLGLADPAFLTDLLFGASLLRRSTVVLVAMGVASLLGKLLAKFVSLRGALTAWSVSMLVVGAWSFLAASPERQTRGAPPALPPLTPSDPPPPPVVLLVVDGADLSVLRPLMERGELPAFQQLTKEGVWGSLATIRPTLSAVVWTTIATGKPPEEHGIHHFVSFSLPGLSQVVQRFPVHTGLNFTLFPWIEKIPGFPRVQVPNTSTLRQAQALWNMVGRVYPVGVYRWLVSWPAEPVEGFYVSGGVAWAQFFEGFADGRRPAERSVHPADLFSRIDRPSRPRPRDEDLRRYLSDDATVDADDPRARMIRGTLRDVTAQLLPRLMTAFDSRFTAASFYSVDPFSHFFARDRLHGGPFAPAIDERYRELDARLGEFLAALPEDAHVILISDHGYDFEHDHHTWAPPGVLFARGPAFRRGARVRGLSVYDVAPLVLHLLDLPLPRDLPGTGTARYRRTLRSEWLESHSASTVATYETPDDGGELAPERSPRDGEIREVLESLGYVR